MTTKTPAAAAKTSVQITAIATVDIPTPTRQRGQTSPYPFDQLEVGASFGVMNKTKKEMSSIVSNQNRRHRTEKRDADGNIVYKTKPLTNPDGSKIQVPDTNSPEFVVDRHFVTIEVTDEIKAVIKGTPLEGSTVIVKRDI